MMDAMGKVEPTAKDRFAHLTDAQRRAIRTTDGSVLVSAAAGSGKTTVLAERCAYLVCDLPREQRCSVNELLVVTFTDAAAGEMRARIGAAIRQRLDEQRHEAYLREQLYLLDSASISTIHAFCKTIVQKWFPQANIDPQAVILSGDEAELLRRETLDDLLRSLYARRDDFGLAFQALVDQYGAGDDRQIGEIVLQIHAFINSLSQPEKWLEQAVRQFDLSASDSLAAQVDARQAERIRDELDQQIDYAQHVIRTIRAAWPVAADRAESAGALADQLRLWRDRLAQSPSTWEQVAAEVCGLDFGRLRSRPRNLSDEDREAFEAATELFGSLKKLVFARLRERLCRFTAEQYRDGLARTGPFVATFTQIVRELNDRYQQAKSLQATMDFNDLQRGALRLLADSQEHAVLRPSNVALQLQRQYRYVLVDEFQDVDPLQASILRLVSRESAEPPCGNLFTVGDIKQSIYRFRLAEPTLFTDRAEAFATDLSHLGPIIHLQENFRSRCGVIDAVNRVFRALMSASFGGSAYDALAELHTGATYPHSGDAATFELPAVELHLLEPVTEQTRSEDADQGGDADASDGERSSEAGHELEGIEREAVLIAQRIRSWMGLDGGPRWSVAGRPETSGGAPSLRPIGYGDVVILLRAMLHKAEPIAEILRRMSIPVRIEGGDDSLDSTEFRDIYSLLQVLDNPQQDIPLAAVLRAPMLGDALDASDLLKLRLIDDAVPFHAAVRQYALNGPDTTLRERLTGLLQQVARLRTRMQREPVADVLWDIYEQSGYLAFVSGLPDGAQRRGQLIRLHELARQFGRFARQGLRRFLRFLDDMVEQERGGPPAGASAAGENAVRIMTVHASKGLEFPVVILADLAKQFNMSDGRGVALVDRKLGLALQVADAERRIRYPTLLHQLAADQSRDESLSEELRVLYVALTRAREHLLLVGRCSLKSIAACRAGAGLPADPPSRMQLESAQNILDWLLPALGTMLPESVDWSGRSASASGALFSVRVYERAETDDWRIPPAQRPETADTLARAASLDSLPPDEPMDPSSRAAECVAALKFIYPGLELTTFPARTSVTELKGTHPPEDELDERARRRDRGLLLRPAFMEDGPVEPDAVARGTATHRLLQLLDLAAPCDPADLERQRQAMIAGGRISSRDAASVDLSAVDWFLQTDLGRRVRQAVSQVQREVPFVARVQPDRLDAMVHARDARDVLLVRGMVDLVLVGPDALELLDFKTDDVAGPACDERAVRYRPQLTYYAEALAAAYRLPVARRWLVFLKARRVLEVVDSGLPGRSDG